MPIHRWELESKSLARTALAVGVYGHMHHAMLQLFVTGSSRDKEEDRALHRCAIPCGWDLAPHV